MLSELFVGFLSFQKLSSRMPIGWEVGNLDFILSLYKLTAYFWKKKKKQTKNFFFWIHLPQL